MKGLLALSCIAVLVISVPRAQESQDPLDSEVVEQVRVRLVIVDALVVDRQGRTVPDLGLQDFELFVDSSLVAIDTVDVNCPGGAAADPVAVRKPEDRPPPAAADAPRRIVLVLDYLHLSQTDRVSVLEQVRGMVRSSKASNEELMVVALNGGLRIEQKFTSDRTLVLDTLDRMEYDISLWRPVFHHLSESGLAGGLTALSDLLEPIPGPKAVLFFSRMLGPSGGAAPGSGLVEMDGLFESVAAAATRARASLYTVHAAGMTTRKIWGALRDGSLPAETAPRLARFAIETGGRYTEKTNDLSLAYARAQRDLVCRYAVGFYDRSGLTDVVHRVTLNVNRPGLRVIHPGQFEFRRESVRRESLLKSAHITPEAFQDGVVRSHFFPMRPAGKKAWEGQLAVSFPVAIAEGQDGVRDFGAVIRTDTRVVHRLDRRITLRGGEPEGSRRFTFIEPVTLRPGRYELAVVVADPEQPQPMTAVAALELPELPRKELFLVGPVLGRRAGDTVVVSTASTSERTRGAVDAAHDRVGNAESFVPLLVQRVDEPGPLVAITRVCRIGSPGRGSAGSVARRLVRRDGEVIGSLPEVELSLEGDNGVRCQSLVDLLPLGSAGAGEYTFTATILSEDAAGAPVESLLNFAIGERATPAGAQ